MIKQLSRYGSVALAHAIIERGIKENDQQFLQSDWYDWLVMFCRLGDAQVQRKGKTLTGEQEVQ